MALSGGGSEVHQPVIKPAGARAGIPRFAQLHYEKRKQKQKLTKANSRFAKKRALGDRMATHITGR